VSNAYMLVYVRKDTIADLLRPVEEEEVPEVLRKRCALSGVACEAWRQF
jgi:hypothetical protein